MIEIVAHARYDKSRKHSAINVQIHIRVADRLKNKTRDPVWLHAQFKKWVAGVPTAKGVKISAIQWEIGRNRYEPREVKKNTGVKAALRRARFTVE